MEANVNENQESLEGLLGMTKDTGEAQPVPVQVQQQVQQPPRPEPEAVAQAHQYKDQ